ncbi:MAG: transglutaminase domain-containing protein [Planctomycetes bacterium]|nr:transglutaminase domain-containing protein [Planctomycetota bacterium]
MNGARARDRLHLLALLGCTVLALVSLPPAELPRGWLLAWTLPSASLAVLFRWTARFWQRGALGALLQGGAVAAAILLAEPLSRPAALACTILPPLAFVAVRRQDSDAALALFLSFCVLLVGTILGGLDLPRTVAYGALACLCLRCDALRAAHEAGGGPTASRWPALRLLGSTALLALPCLLVALTIERTLAIVPPLVHGPAAPPAAPGEGTGDRRRIGLGDSFVLDGNRGPLADLHGEQLVRVAMADGSLVPRDLYLRSGFFAVPGLDRWQLGQLAPEANTTEPLRLRAPRTPGRIVWLEVERFAGARNFVFVPPGTCEVHGAGALEVDRAREWLRQRPGEPLRAYEVSWQDLPPPADARVDPRAQRLGLLALPADLDRAPFLALLERWQAQGSPMAIAERIAAGLARRCRYDRLEPTGPYAHALQNFLFAAGDRRGYCMHFASAAALLLRLAGVPCRIGVGLYGGDVDRADRTARIYGSQHAHAWVEIPWQGRGYVVFDPTPPAERGARMPSVAAPMEALDPAPAAAPAPAPGPDGLLGALLQPWVLGIALLLAAVVRLRPGTASGPAAQPATAPVRSARRQLAHLLRALAAAGEPRGRGQTLETYARELVGRRGPQPELLDALLAYQEVRFGGRPFDAPRERRLAAGLAAAVQLAAPAAR